VAFQIKFEGMKRIYIVETKEGSNDGAIFNNWKSNGSRISKDWESNIGYEIDYLNLN
jgi:hypothetical protein